VAQIVLTVGEGPMQCSAHNKSNRSQHHHRRQNGQRSKHEASVNSRYTPPKCQSSEWFGELSLRLEKLCFQKSKVKTMLIVFFDSQGIVHKEFVQEGCTFNAEYYKGVSDHLISHNGRVCPALYCTRDFSLLHDNAPAHSAAKIRQFLTQ